MISEFRIYTLHPGRLEAFKMRFLGKTLGFFEKHGIEFSGFWEIGDFPVDAIPQRSAGGIVREAKGASFGGEKVAYMVSFDSLEQRDKAWLDFVADEDWQRIRTESEADGPIVKDETSFLLREPVREQAK